MNKYLASSAWLIAEKVMKLFSDLVISILLIRYLQPEGFGIYSYVISVVTIFLALSQVGINPLLIKFFSQSNQNKAIFSTAFYLRLLGSVVAITILVGIALVYEPDSRLAFLLIGGLAILTSPFLIIEQFFLAGVAGKTIAILRTAQQFVSLVLKCWGLATYQAVDWFVIVYVLDAIVLASLFFIALMRDKAFECSYFYVSNFDVVVLKRLVKPAIPLFLGAISVMLYMRIDQVMITAMLGEEENGIYAAAVKISEAWYFLPVVFCAAIFPRIVELKTESTARYHQIMKMTYGVFFYIAIGFTLFIILAGELIISQLLGDAYISAYTSMVLLSFAGLFVAWGVVSSYWLINEGLEKHSFYRTSVGCIFNIALNIVMIPSFGIEGAAIATLLSQIFAALLYDLIFEQTRIVFFQKINSWLQLKHILLITKQIITRKLRKV